MDSKMINNYISVITESYNETIKLCNELKKTDYIEKFKAGVLNKLNEIQKPVIMFYGFYNAGKSSLLNAIYGKNIAKTADIPTTDKIDKYEWNGYTLYDSPGLDAPIEHETISNEHLKNCEIIIFVLSNNGTFEEEKIYKEILKIINLNKKMIIVLNKKTVYDSKEEGDIELYKIKDKIINNLHKFSNINIDQLSKKYDIIEVNAKSALKAKLENKNILLENSGINELEKIIMMLLENSTILDNLKTPISNLILFLEQLEKNIKDSRSNNDEQKHDKINSEIYTQKTYLKKEIANKIKEISYILEEDLYDTISKMLFENVQQEKEIYSNNQIEIKIKEIIEKYNQKLSKKYETISEEAKTFIENNLKNLNFKNEKYNALVLYNQPNMPMNIIMNENPNLNLSVPEIKENSPSIIKTAVNSQIEKAIFRQIITKIPIPFPPKLIIDAIFIVKGIIDYFNKKDEESYKRKQAQIERKNMIEQQKAEQKKTIAQELKTSFKRMVWEVSNNMEEAFNSDINQAFKDYESFINNLITVQNNDDKKLSLSIKKIQEIKDKIYSLNVL